jgi:hypothetical protein
VRSLNPGRQDLEKKKSLGKESVRSRQEARQFCTPFLMGLFEFLESSFLISLYILDISPLSDLGLVKILSQPVRVGLISLLGYTSILCFIEDKFCLKNILIKEIINLLFYMYV